MLSKRDLTKVSGRIAVLDVLRFLAAFLVMLYHYQPYILKYTNNSLVESFRFGYLGVNFFFMLSGFVIMASAQNRTAFKFAILRAVRLYPAFISCLLLTLLVLYIFGKSLPSIYAILLNGLIINDYLSVKNVDGVYWTLQAELKFYACMFLLIAFSLIVHYRIWLSIWLLLAVFFHFFQQPFFLGWFISPSYSFYFIGGIAAYHLYFNPRNIYFLVVMVVAMVFSAIKSWSQIDSFCVFPTQGDRVIASLISIVCFIFFIFLRPIDKRIPHFAWMSILGGISYPLYLLHSRAGRTLLEYIERDVGIWIALALTISLVMLASLLVHLFIERRLFRAVRRHV